MAITADVIPLSQCETEVVSTIGKSSSKRKKNDDQDGLRGSLAMISPEVQENTADNSTVMAIVPLSQEERPQTKKRKQTKKRATKKRKRSETNQQQDKVRAGASRDCTATASECTTVATTTNDCTIIDILAADGHVKSVEKRKSMIAHFDFFLALRVQSIKNNTIKGREIVCYEDITYDDLNETTLCGEFATYLGNDAKKYLKPNGVPISYQTATGKTFALASSIVSRVHECLQVFND